MSVIPEIKITEDGSQTLSHPVFGDAYHSLRGAVGESEHVFIKEGFLHNQANPITILEIGLGSGLNALLTAEEAEKQKKQTFYYAIELYPVDKSVIAGLEYYNNPVFRKLHDAKWGETVQISPYFSIHKIEASLINYKFDETFDLIYFDAFAPDTQPEMWSEAVFAELWRCMAQGGELVTYSSKGVVKQNLRNTGFEVKRLPGALGKHHMLRAVKKDSF